jgi:thioredoxin 1
MTDAEGTNGVGVVPVDSHACRRCGQVLFRADEVVGTRPLWDLGEERNEVYLLRSASGLADLRRYDASLHEGWYCCRFALMRMTTDKFGTGKHLLAYTGDVALVRAGERPQPSGDVHRGQVRVTSRDFPDVVERDAGDHLSVVKLGATWCPPCRLMDSVITRLDEAGALPDVRFFEADVDSEQELGARFEVRSLPTFRFWYRGEPLEVSSRRLPSVDGAIVGGLRSGSLAEVTTAVLAAARQGHRRIVLR